MSEQEFMGYHSPIDDIRSAHVEKQRSREYGNETLEGYQYSEVALRSIYRHWTAELDNPIRSDRSKKEAKNILDAVVIEMYHRAEQIDGLEKSFEL
jgi:hypothetical protein